MNKIIYSSDVDVLQSNLIVFENNTCLYIVFDHDNENFIVYSFDLLKVVENWIDLKDINSSCDTNYTTDLKETDFIDFTNDVCWYYGAINLDGCPNTYDENELLQLINDIENVS